MRSIFSPKPWQPAMMEWIAEHPRCALFAGMGSGKTGSTLIGLDWIDIMDQAPGLIIAPKRVVRDTWPVEAQKWSALTKTTVVPVIGTQTQRLQALRTPSKWYVINYEQLPWLVEFYGKARWPFRTIVADESTRLKGHRARGQGGQRTNALAKVAWLPQVERFILLTGTPAPNGIKDLWGQMWFLDQGHRLGASHTAFMERWFVNSFDGHSVDPQPWAQRQVQEKIGDLCLTIDPRDYIDIAHPIESDVVVHLPDNILDQYQKMERQMFIELAEEFGGHEVEAVNAGAKTNKCLQMAAGSIYHDKQGNYVELHKAKIEALESIVEEANGMPVLVSYIYRSDLERLVKHFPQLVPIDKANLDDWNAGRIPMMAAHPASAGHGLNLQHGSNILADFTSGWDLEYDLQVIERIGPMRQHQAGLNRPVFRYRIMAHGTVDFLVKKRRDTKQSVQTILLEAMKHAQK